MKYKKFSIFVVMLIVLVIIPTNEQVYASDSGNVQWVQDAFNATGSFLEENFSNVDVLNLDSWFVPLITVPLKIINRVLIVALFGLSTVALSYCGIQFIIHSDNPSRQKDARENIRTTFIAMGYGFGAYLIWSVAMQIVTLILGQFAS